MPMRDCPECAGQMSTRAVACPHCGHPAGLDRARLAGLLVVVGVSMAMVVFFFIIRSRGH